MDDFAVPVEGDSPNQVVACLASVASRIRALGRRRGFEVNFKEGKTEAVVAFFDPGVAQARSVLSALEWRLEAGPCGRAFR